MYHNTCFSGRTWSHYKCNETRITLHMLLSKLHCIYKLVYKTSIYKQKTDLSTSAKSIHVIYCRVYKTNEASYLQKDIKDENKVKNIELFTILSTRTIILPFCSNLYVLFALEITVKKFTQVQTRNVTQSFIIPFSFCVWVKSVCKKNKKISTV